jgi:hypothetical protein
MDVYVVDTGQEEVYVLASNEVDAAEQVVSMTGQPINYAEFYSDDPENMP